MTTAISHQSLQDIRTSIDTLATLLPIYERIQKETTALYDNLCIAHHNAEDDRYLDALQTADIIQGSLSDASRNIASAIDNLEHINL